MIGLLIPFTTSLNHSQFATAHNKSLAEPLTAEDWLRSRSATDSLYFSVLLELQLRNSTHFLSTDPTENTYILECMFIGPLPSNGRPVVDSVIPGMFLPSRCLAMVICVTVIYSEGICFQRLMIV
jgi:hypothetical protein